MADTETTDTDPSGGAQDLELPVIGMHCANCARAVERALAKKHEGVSSATVNYAAENVRVVYDPARVRLEQLADSVRDAGYRLVLPEPGADGEDAETVARKREQAAEKRALLAGLVFTIPLFLLSMAHDWGAISPAAADRVGLKFLLFLLATPVQFYTGRGFYTGAWHSLKSGAANMDVLVALGSTTAYLYSVVVLFTGAGHMYFETAALIITLIKLGKWMEVRAKGRAGSAIRDLMKRVPATARVVGEDGEPLEVPLHAVGPGDLVLVRPGETIPLDGVVEKGGSSVDASMLTGESTPVEAGPGAELFGGTMNIQGALTVRVTRAGSDSAVARIIARVKQAQGSKAPIQRLADRVAAVFVPVIVSVALVTLAVWWIFSGSFEASLVRLVAVLVIACPCAMGLATPTAIITGMGSGAKAGVLFRDAEAVEVGAKLRVVAFDKTGTLTRGRPELRTIVPAGNTPGTELLKLSAWTLYNSSHPLAQAVVRAAKERGIEYGETAMFDERAGFGVKAMLDNGKLIRVGKPEEFENVPAELRADVERLRERGETVSLVSDRYQLLGALGFADMPRDEAKQAVAELKRMGLRTAMLSGDHRRIAELVGHDLGVDEVRGELLPGDKEDAVVAFREQARGAVAVVGDGINDAPALARSDLGIAVGGGTDVAIESAGVTLPGDDLRGVPRAIRLSRHTVRVIRQNLFWAFFYNVALVPVAAGVLMLVPGSPAALQQLHPAFAAAAMAFSSVTVVFNSLRLNRITLD